MKPVLPAPYHKKTVADIKPEDTSVVIDELESEIFRLDAFKKYRQRDEYISLLIKVKKQASKQARPKRRDHGEWDSHSEYMIYARRAIRR